MISIPSYETKPRPFPRKDIDPATKDSKYCRLNAEAIYSLYCRNKTSWGVSAINYFDEMRRYADGNQSVEQYKSFLTGTSSSDSTASTFTLFDDKSPETMRAKREGWYNLLWQNLSPASKIMNGIHGMIDKIDYDVLVDTIDSDSRGLIEFVKYKKFHEAAELEWQNEYKTKAGIPIDENVNFPRTPEELMAFEAQEGFKLNIAKAMQKLVRHSFNISDWDGTIRKKVIDDLIATGYCAVLDLYDSEDRQYKAQYLDPRDTVIQFSKEHDYRDSEYGGYFKLETISNCKRRKPEVDEDTWYALAEKNKLNFSNPNLNWNDRGSLLDPTTGTYSYDCFNVPVFYAYWIDTDIYKKLYFTRTNGREGVRDIDFGYKPARLTPNQAARGMTQEIKSTTIRNCYKCVWVVDSDIVFEHGILEMGDRPQPSKPKIPIHVEQLTEPSIIYRLKPVFDDIALIWLNHQNAMSKQIVRGYAVNMGMLMGITLNKKNLDPADVLKKWRQSGILPYMYNYNGQYGGGAATPITPIEGGMGNEIQNTALALETAFANIEKVVGINPMAFGATPTAETQVGTTDVAIQATLNVLRPVLHCTFEIKASAGTSMMRRMQVGLRISKDIREAYSGIVSPSDIMSMVMAEHDGVQYGMELRPKPTEGRILDLKRYMELGIRVGDITPVEAMFFSERIEAGSDLIEIRQQIAYAVKKNQERKQAEAQANIDRQSQNLAQLEQVKSQNKQNEIMLEGKVKTQEEAVRIMGKKANALLENNFLLYQKLYEDMIEEEGLRINKNI